MEVVTCIASRRCALRMQQHFEFMQRHGRPTPSRRAVLHYVSNTTPPSRSVKLYWRAQAPLNRCIRSVTAADALSRTAGVAAAIAGSIAAASIFADALRRRCLVLAQVQDDFVFALHQCVAFSRLCTFVCFGLVLMRLREQARGSRALARLCAISSETWLLRNRDTSTHVPSIHCCSLTHVLLLSLIVCYTVSLRRNLTYGDAGDAKRSLDYFGNARTHTILETTKSEGCTSFREIAAS